MNTSCHLAISLALVAILTGCTKGTTFGVPDLAPIVADATPTALKPSRGLNHLSPIIPARDINADAVTYLQNMFQGTYGKLSGGNGTGYINAQLEDVDYRLDEINTRSASGAACLSNTSKDHTINLTAINSILDLTLGVQCSSPFNGAGDQSGPGSGLVFGKNGDDFSIWLYLNQQNDSDNFGYFANLKNADTSDKEVDALFLENFPTSNRITTSRLKAKPATQTFELVYASTQLDAGGISGGAAKVGCGFKMISDGSSIYAKGNAVAASRARDCSSQQAFEICVNASDLTTADSGACDTLETSFTMTGQIQSTELAGQGNAIDAVLPIATASDKTSSF